MWGELHWASSPASSLSFGGFSNNAISGATNVFSQSVMMSLASQDVCLWSHIGFRISVTWLHSSSSFNIVFSMLWYLFDTIAVSCVNDWSGDEGSWPDIEWKNSILPILRKSQQTLDRQQGHVRNCRYVDMLCDTTTVVCQTWCNHKSEKSCLELSARRPCAPKRPRGCSGTQHSRSRLA